jgi:hypothetical protein
VDRRLIDFWMFSKQHDAILPAASSAVQSARDASRPASRGFHDERRLDYAPTRIIRRFRQVNAYQLSIVASCPKRCIFSYGCAEALEHGNSDELSQVHVSACLELTVIGPKAGARTHSQASSNMNWYQSNRAIGCTGDRG